MTLDDLKEAFIAAQKIRVDNRYQWKIDEFEPGWTVDDELRKTFDDDVKSWANRYNDGHSLIHDRRYNKVDYINCGKTATMYMYALEYGMDAAVLKKLSMVDF